MRRKIFAAVCFMFGAVVCGAEELVPPVGFFNSYPVVEVGMDDAMPRVGPSLLACIAGGFSMNPQEGRYDFTALDRQIAYAARHKLPMSIISEVNPLFVPPWLAAKAKAAGELVRNGSGAEGTIPSTTSAVFRRAQEQLIQKVVEHLRENKQGHIVRYIHPGAEWWFPYADRYHPADIARFRKWLAGRYRTIDELNAAWQSRFRSFDDVPAPRLETVGNFKGTQLLRPVALDGGYQDCSWSTSQATDPKAQPGRDGVIAVTPGRRYTFSAWVRGERVTGRGAYLELAWVRGSGGPPLVIDSSVEITPRGDWERIQVEAAAPADAGRAWPLLKFAGTGMVVYDDVCFIERGREANLASNGDFQRGDASPQSWHFQNWTGGKNVRSAYSKRGGRGDTACVRIQVDPLDAAARGYANEQAAVYDWAMFWNETAAEYVNRMSALVKRFDATRKTVSYLTYSFAFPAEWDYAQQVAIAPDEVARRGRDIDVLGMQLCSADGDPFRTTCCLDVVRKYGKPMWVVDLVDFTSGIHSGLPAMEQATQLAIAHGAEGIVYCGWHLTFVQDYSFWPAFGESGLRRMTTQAQAAIARTRGLTVRPSAALVHTMMPLSAQDGPEGKNDFRSFLGWYKALESIQETVDVVTLRELELAPTRLGRYRYVVVPDCAYLPRGSLEALGRYARQGGVLISAGRFAQFDEFGHPVTDALRGAVARIALADDGRAAAGAIRRDTHAGNTPPLFLWDGEKADVRAALARAAEGLLHCKEQRGLPAGVALRPASLEVRCAQWTGKDRQLAYLVNLGKSPVEGRQLVLRDVPAGAVRVLADLAPTPCPATRDGSVLRVSLPRFQICCLVEVSSEPPAAKQPVP